MWLAVLLSCALAASAARLCLRDGKRLGLGILALMLWGAAIMASVDRAAAWLEEGGLPAPEGPALGALMAAPLAAAWGIAALSRGNPPARRGTLEGGCGKG
jgi:hypothetical protein